MSIFLVLEMFLWTKPLGLKTFSAIRRRKAAGFRRARRQSGTVQRLFLAAGLIWGLLQAVPGPSLFQIKVFFPALRDRRRRLWRRDRQAAGSWLCKAALPRPRLR